MFQEFKIFFIHENILFKIYEIKSVLMTLITNNIYIRERNRSTNKNKYLFNVVVLYYVCEMFETQHIQ